MSEMVLTKQCKCKGATASGPRPVLTDTRVDRSLVRISGAWVKFACDRCDTPWRPRAAQPGSEG